ELFTNIGMERQQFKKEEFRTLGNAAYSPSDQVAIIADWIDKDKDSFQSSLFDGKGFESTADKGWFFNRKFKNISELANVPGITLNELQYLSKFLKVTISSLGTNSAININTAPVEVLQAIGFPENQIEEIARQRLSYPYTTQSTAVLTAGNEQLKGKVKFKSSEFSAIARIEMPTKVFWVKSRITMLPGVGNRRAKIDSYEFY
ncbi:MAG: general secretion pathway protein GspK, partial [Proteobacteria bacterium]|nr:general secretion pathway protein GspK [Pseudomonadota bacterium]